eukprot:TRINITY_DN2294_c0_g1_i10.p1 TRINITY_DN2294_c0_g1~~TRINITY_DN2294_c0_g1_i10.p1  ORF type:complete len:312 (+),score=71.23 TRINITY_DN2294_c0_g1_i10:496-1431(+)
MYVKVWDAKELRNGRDTFVAIITNSIEKARTSTEWQTSAPLYNSESEFSIEEKDTAISFFVYDMRKNHNLPISYASISISLTQPTPTKPVSLPLTPFIPPNVSIVMDVERPNPTKVLLTVTKVIGLEVGKNKDKTYTVVGYTNVRKGNKSISTATYTTEPSASAMWKGIPWEFDLLHDDPIKLELLQTQEDYDDCLGQVFLTSISINNSSQLENSANEVEMTPTTSTALVSTPNPLPPTNFEVLTPVSNPNCDTNSMKTSSLSTDITVHPVTTSTGTVATSTTTSITTSITTTNSSTSTSTSPPVITTILL